MTIGVKITRRCDVCKRRQKELFALADRSDNLRFFTSVKNHERRGNEPEAGHICVPCIKAVIEAMERGR